MKRDHPFTGMKEKDLATSAERFTTACHTLARMNDFHPLAPSRSDAHIHSETRGKGNTHTHTHTWYINNGNICFKFKPDWPDCSHHLFLFVSHDSCISISLFFFVPVSPTLITAKLDLYSLLPLSLVSLSRNRTKGGRRSSSLYWGFDMKSVLSKLMEFCVWQCVLWCGAWACVHAYGVFSVWRSQRRNAGSVRHCTKTGFAKTACCILV